MVQETKSYILQYKVLFYLSWICLYLIFPSWISLHSIFTSKGLSISDPFARALVILGFIIYFSISAFLINRYFSILTINKPVIIKINDWLENIKSNLWLVIICCLSVVLHIYPLSLVLVVTGGGEIPYIQQPLSIYDSLNSYWDRVFDIPIQYLFWSIIMLLILITKQKKTINSILNYISARASIYKSNNLIPFFSIIIMFVFFSKYSYLFPYYSYESLYLLRYPPVSKFIYLITYYAFGISYMGPRIVQLIFYVLGAVYLYRTIYLFREKETALLGATIYLFSPIMFSYASRAAIESGVVFFMILISFHFLRFIKNKDDRDLILTSYFIGIGFMYKQVALPMLIVCFAYLILSTIKKRDWHAIIHFKILLLSLIIILPFFMIGKMVGLNFYAPALSNLMAFDHLFMVIQSQISVILSLLTLFSISFILFKRDDLSLFFGFYFIVYYVFFTLKGEVANQRYSMALYPAIAVLLAQFIFSITQRLRYKHIFKLSFSILTVYLIFLCLVPRASSSLVTYKYADFEEQYYPFDEATDWIKNRTGNNEKILSLFITNYEFYVDRVYADKSGINKDRFLHYGLEPAQEVIYPLKNLKEFCYSEKISYIMFPYGPKNASPDMGASKEAKDLKEYSDNELIKVAKFNREDNYIFIYKLKEKIPN